jgi:hypothetical protein
MKRLLLPIIPLFLFTQCEPEPQELKVSYTVIEVTQEQPAYSITYTSNKARATNTTSSSEDSWSSGTILLEQGEFISLKVECNEPVYNIKLKIYVSGMLWKEEQFANPVPSASVSGTL